MSVVVKDGLSADKYFQTIGAGTLANPFQSVVPEYRLAHAVKIIKETYAHDVDIWSKAKTLTKFGRNQVVGTTFETLTELQGTEPNETFVTTNIIDSIVSSNAGDTTQTIVIEGFTIDLSGLLTFVVQEKLLTGQTEATLDTPLARATRAYVKNSGVFGSTPTTLAGTVSIYDNTGGVSVGGVPNTASGTKLIILPGATQSEKCATATQDGNYWIITGLSAAMGITGGPSVDYAEVRIEVRDIPNGGAWRPLGRTLTVVPNQLGKTLVLDPVYIVPPNHDVRMRAKVNANQAEIYGEMTGYLAEVY